METKEKVDELQDYALMENDEFSETCLILVELYRYREGLSGEMQKTLADEVSAKLEWYKENTKIVEREETTTKTRTVRELVYT